MKPNRLFPSLLLAAAMALLLLTAARADDNTGSIKFSDPSKPGTVKIQIGRGSVRVRGGDAPEVTVKSDAKPATKAMRKDGLRVLTSSSSYALSEKDNVITLDAISDGWHGSGADFSVTVPRSSNVIITNSWGGDVSCTQIAGDVEIKSLNGAIRLDGISGAALVETMNGEIRATVAELRDNKPLSFTSMNGEIVLRVPPAAKANVRIRTQNGSVLTDFEESDLVTKTETSPHAVVRTTREVLPAQARDAIREAARAGAEAVRDAASALQEAASAAKAGAEAAQRDSDVTPPRPPMSPKPPRAPRVPTIPTITGGKLITGTLNGGGPEISISTMNGDVTLRRLSDAK